MASIERAARALCHLDGKDPDTLIKPSNFQTSVPPKPGRPLWERYTPHARAVLEAIREPDQSAVEAGATKFRGIGLQTEAAVTEAWQAMIDTALQEG